jgi:actin related protein 2/3 complex, subunit 1A/1B
VALTWTSEDALVAAGHDCQPLVFSGTEQGWSLVGSLDAKSGGGSKASGSGGGSVVGRLNSAAFNTFKNAAERGQSGGGTEAARGSGDTVLHTMHQNTITSVRPYGGSAGGISHVSTSGVDGRLVVWDVNAVAEGGLASKLASKLRLQ